jgi:hypothetical protein
MITERKIIMIKPGLNSKNRTEANRPLKITAKKLGR